MIQFEQHKGNNKIDIVEEQQQLKHSLVGRLKVKKGLKLWKYSGESKLITQVEFSRIDVKLDGSLNKNVELERNCLYFQALNYKNAKHKVEKKGFVVNNKKDIK